MKILIVSKYFAPENRIASVRATKIAKYLKQMTNNEVSVITINKEFIIIDDILKKDIQEIDNIIRIKESNWVLWLNKKIKNITSTKNYETNYRNVKIKKDNLTYKEQFKKKLLVWIYFFINWIEDLDFYHNAKKYTKNNKIDYDIIISTYGPHSSHYIGRYLKERNKQSFWIADFRDVVYNSDVPILFKRYSKNFANSICKKSDVISGVSEGLLNGLFLKENKSKYIITNGYDTQDLSNVLIDNKNQNKKLIFTYTGQLYKDKSDFSIFFKALNELITEDKIDHQHVAVHYAGNCFNELINQAIKYNLEDILIDFGYIKRSDSLKLQLNCDILLLASWNEINSTGIVTGKYMEYLMVHKPILCIITGDLENSSLRQMIQNANAGYCFEHASNNLNEYEYLKQYILMQYENKAKNNTLKYEPDLNEIWKYNYINIAEQIMNIYYNFLNKGVIR